MATKRQVRYIRCCIAECCDCTISTDVEGKKVRIMARKRMATPLDYWLLSMKAGQMMAEAQMVIGFRMMGMAGAWPVTPSENARMVSEKLPAFVEAGGKATVAAMQGRRPDEIIEAALRPIGVKTNSNARRLAKRRR